MAKSVIYEIGLRGDAYVSTAKKVQTEVDRLTARQKELTKANLKSSEEYQRNAAALKENKTQLNFLQKQIGQNQAEQELLNKTTAKANALMKEEAVTINQLRNQNKELLKIKNNLNLKNKEELKLAQQIDAKLDQNTQSLKENSDAYTAQKMNIGNYASALDGLDPRISGVIRNLGQMKEGLMSQKAALVASTNATSLASKAMKVFRLALISTGIGALIVALGTLVSYFSTTQRGADTVSKAMAAIGATVDVVIDRLSLLGEGLYKIVTGDFKEGWELMRDAVKGVADEIRNEAGAALELEEANQRLLDREIELLQVKARKQRQIEELRLQAKDEQTDLTKRAELLEQAGNLEKSILDDELEIARERARISEEQLAMSESSRDDIRATEELKARVIELETESLKKQRSIEAEKQGLLKRARAEEVAAYKAREAERAKENADAEKQAEKEKIEAEKKDQEELARIAAFEERKRELENQIALENAETEQEKEILKLEQDAEKQILELEKIELTEAEKTELLALIEENRGELLQNIRDKYADLELKKIAESNKKVEAQEKEHASQREMVAKGLTGILIGLLGDSLGAKLASIAIEAGVEAGLVAINSSSAQAINLAQATAAAPPPLNAPLIAAAGVQNAVIKAQAAKSISQILAGAAIQGLGTIVGDKFADGGILQGASHANGGIKTPFGELEGGEGVINKRSMSNPFLRSLASAINEAGGGRKFADGGVLSTPSMSSASSVLNIDAMAAKIAEAVSELPSPVVTVEDINAGLDDVAQVVQVSSV